MSNGVRRVAWGERREPERAKEMDDKKGMNEKKKRVVILIGFLSPSRGNPSQPFTW